MKIFFVLLLTRSKCSLTIAGMLDGAERLREWVHRSRCTKGEAAKMLGIGQVYLSQLLHRKRKPGLETAVRIEQVTGISVESWLLTEVSDDTSDELEDASKPA